MTMVSETYADLGGGLSATSGGKSYSRSERVSRTVDTSHGRVCDRHLFDPVSGWCGCGTRDDGKLAEGSPAWRAEVERRMPEVSA